MTSRYPHSGAQVPGAVLENLATSVLVVDPGLILVYLNPAAEELFAVSAHKARGAPLAALASDPAHLEARVRRVFESLHTFTERELVLTLAGGQEVTLDLTLTPMHHGEVRQVLIELQQMDRQLRISREDNLLAQHRAAQELLRGLAHEIKNPLGGLRGAAQLLERELVSEEQREYTRIIMGEADRLQKLMDRMLGPNNLPRKSTTNIHEVLEHVSGVVEAEGGDGVEIDRDYDPSVPDLLADPDMLVQAFMNIMRNASQAMKGSGAITIRTRARRQVNIGHKRHKLALCVDVCDNGPGIPEEIMGKIFYPMVTYKSGGTGLGLSIAQSLVNSHGGFIECESHPGNTRFRIYLPLEWQDEQ